MGVSMCINSKPYLLSPAAIVVDMRHRHSCFISIVIRLKRVSVRNSTKKFCGNIPTVRTFHGLLVVFLQVGSSRLAHNDNIKCFRNTSQQMAFLQGNYLPFWLTLFGVGGTLWEQKSPPSHSPLRSNDGLRHCLQKSLYGTSCDLPGMMVLSDHRRMLPWHDAPLSWVGRY